MSETSPETGASENPPPIQPLSDYADPRDQGQLSSDAAGVEAQAATMISPHNAPNGVDAMVEILLARRTVSPDNEAEGGVAAQPVVTRAQRFQAAGPPPGTASDQRSSQEDRIALIEPDILIVPRSALADPRPVTPYAAARPEAPAPEGPASDEATGEVPSDPNARQSLQGRDLRSRIDRDYVRVDEPEPPIPGVGGPDGPGGGRRSLVQRFRPRDPDRGGDEATRRRLTAEDAQSLRAETGAEVNVSYLCTLGHIIKGVNHPLPTASRPSFGPDWVRRYLGTTPVTVAVIDTGIVEADRGDGWLGSVPRAWPTAALGVIDPLNVFPLGVPNDPNLDLGAGHGTFVAGVIERVSPGSKVVVYRAVDSDGLGREEDVANAMVQAADDGVQIINVSLGIAPLDDVAPVALREAVEILEREHPDVLIVASAGNMGDSLPVYPAAFKNVIAVGALDDAGHQAPWSNHGPWVDCSVVGVGVLSTFVEGTVQTWDENGVQGPGVAFSQDPFALWSGTSFAAPQIAGLVARMVQTGHAEKPRQAYLKLVQGTPVMPGYGHTLRILPGTPTAPATP